MTKTIMPAPVRKSVRVGVAPERAFDIFTGGIGRWWPKSHHVGAADLDTHVIEPRTGGRWYERNVDGSECEVGKVLAWEPPGRLLLAWQLSPEWKYDPDLLSEVEIRFTPDDGGTRVDLEHRRLEGLGANAAQVREQVDAPNGWSRLLQLYADLTSEEGR